MPLRLNFDPEAHIEYNMTCAELLSCISTLRDRAEALAKLSWEQGIADGDLFPWQYGHTLGGFYPPWLYYDSYTATLKRFSVNRILACYFWFKIVHPLERECMERGVTVIDRDWLPQAVQCVLQEQRLLPGECLEFTYP